MFSTKIITTTAETWANYSYNSGSLHIHYDKTDEFHASLDILTDNDSKKIDSVNFGSLVYTFNNKKERNRALLSIMKIDDNTILFNISDNINKFLSHKIEGISEIIPKIALQTKCIFIGRVNSNPYFTDEKLIAQSKKLLESFNSLAKGILNSSEPVKSSTKALDKISNLLNLEIAEFNNLIELNEISSPSPRLR